MSAYEAVICQVGGHIPQNGPYRRSPNTVYTHWHDVTCSRCGKVLAEHVKDYFDARDPANRHLYILSKAGTD